ncbi:hypothetical protein [Ectothiorhodospira sp. BSL-9]|uniref:hypothetical protein n=1 Tax=Ectothiorhodospira sp. BSL-9 TaxID=1442136 RepID=UPI0007B53A45|nr:hypothetical protein [Ectothiorhodospira sp. BSL-9]TVQ72421.1 MAG: hypothetical protein EA372_07570 [Chromatiaceae bacterium]
MIHPLKTPWPALLLLGALLTGMGGGALAQETRAQVIALEHRPASELMPLLRPLMGPDDVLTGQGFRLVVRTDADTLDALQAVIRDLDTAPANLRVSVRRGGDSDVRDREAGLQTDDDGNLRIRGIHRITTDRGMETHSLRVLEGQVAFIRGGESIPRGSQRVVRVPGGMALEQAVHYEDLERGFLVRPQRMGGDRVRLDIRPVFEREAPTGGGRVERQAAQSTLTAPMGEWVPLSSVSHDGQQRDHRVITTRRHDTWQDTDLFIRVDRVD